MIDIVWEQSGLVRRISGTVDVEAMDASAIAIQSHPRIDEMLYNIHDFSSLVEARLPDGDIEYMAARASASLRRNPRIRIAFVGTHPVVFRLMDAFNASACSPHRVARFDTLDEARRYASAEPRHDPLQFLGHFA